MSDYYKSLVSDEEVIRELIKESKRREGKIPTELTRIRPNLNFFQRTVTNLVSNNTRLDKSIDAFKSNYLKDCNITTTDRTTKVNTQQLFDNKFASNKKAYTKNLESLSDISSDGSSVEFIADYPAEKPPNKSTAFETNYQKDCSIKGIQKTHYFLKHSSGDKLQSEDNIPQRKLISKCKIKFVKSTEVNTEHFFDKKFTSNKNTYINNLEALSDISSDESSVELIRDYPPKKSTNKSKDAFKSDYLKDCNIKEIKKTHYFLEHSSEDKFQSENKIRQRKLISECNIKFVESTDRTTKVNTEHSFNNEFTSNKEAYINNLDALSDISSTESSVESIADYQPKKSANKLKNTFKSDYPQDCNIEIDLKDRLQSTTKIQSRKPITECKIKLIQSSDRTTKVNTGHLFDNKFASNKETYVNNLEAISDCDTKKELDIVTDNQSKLTCKTVPSKLGNNLNPSYTDNADVISISSDESSVECIADYPPKKSTITNSKCKKKYKANIEDNFKHKKRKKVW